MIPLPLRNTWRRLANRPAYSLLSIALLGIGLGAVLFLLGLVNGLILQPLPFPDAGRLVAVGYEKPRNVGLDGMDNDEFDALFSKLAAFDLAGIYNEISVDLVDGKDASHRVGCEISQAVLPLLGIQPLVGRNFTAEDARSGPLTALIGEKLWRSTFGATKDIVGRSVRINGESATIIGVLPGDFAFPYDTEVWLPTRLHVGDASGIDVVARLAPGVSLEQAQAQLEGLAEALGAQLAGQRAGRQLTIKPLALIFVNERTRSFVWLMFAAGLLVLLLACSNVANLQLGQTLERQREFAVRSALGAGRSRLLGEQLLESLLLSCGACLVALTIQHAGANWIRDVFAANGKAPPYFVNLGLDLHLFLLGLAVALVSTALVGLIPAWRASRADVHEDLRDGTRGSQGSVFTRLYKGIVAIEIVLTVILLVGAGTFINGLQRMLTANVGSRTDAAHVLTAKITLFAQQYPDAASRVRFLSDLGERLRSDAGVADATVGNTVPGARLGSHEFIGALGQPRPQNGYTASQMGSVDDNFTSTYDLPLVAGRFFDSRDTAESNKVVVVEKALAELLWPGRDPLGQQLVLRPQLEYSDTLTVIGVVSSMQLDGAMETPMPSMLVTLRQYPPTEVTLAARTQASATTFTPQLEAIVARFDPAMPVYDTMTQVDAIQRSRISAVVLTQVFTFVGIVALVLAAAGLYGVLAFSVERRTREFGIRRAIGAGTGSIIASAGRQLVWQLTFGLAIGVGLSLPWSNLLADPRLQTRGHDGSVFVAVIAIVVLVSLLAAAVPVYRALRVDPVFALRHE